MLTHVFGLISMLFIKRYMGYEDLGMIAFAASYVGLFAILGGPGFNTAHSIRVNEAGLDEGKCNGTFITIKLIMSLMMAIVVLLTILVPKYLFGVSFESQTLEIILYLTILKFSIDALINTFRTMYTSKLEVAKANIPRILGRMLSMFLKISVAVLGLSVVFIAGVELFAGVLILGMFVFLFRKYPIKKMDREYLKIYASYGMPAIFIGLVGSLTLRMDKVLIQFFLGSESVGIYYIPQSITSVLLYVSMTITGLLFPTFSKLYSEKKFDTIQRLSQQSMRYASIILVPCVAFLFIFADPVLVLAFGSDATQSAVVFQILLLAMYINAIRAPYAIHILSTGHLKLGLFLSSLVLLINGVLNLIFIPDDLFGISMLGLGIEGAAYTTLISLTFSSSYAFYYANKITSTMVYPRIWTHVYSGLVMAALGFYFSSISTAWYLLGGYFLVLMGIYFGVLFLLKEFGKDEIDFFMNAIHPGKMKRYITKELKNEK
jgi:O-antigen/teichoic acid export membrane protein